MNGHIIITLFYLTDWVTKRDWLLGKFEQLISRPAVAPCENDVWINTKDWCDGTVHCSDGTDEYLGCKPGLCSYYYVCLCMKTEMPLM